MTTKRVLPLWLLVIFVGIQFGAGWYEKLGIIPLWSDVPPDQVLTAMEESGFKRAGRFFWPFVSPVVALLSLLNLYLARRTPGPARNWWIAGAAIMATYSVTTYGYFATQMLMFQSGGADWTPEHIESFVDLWTTLNYPRMALGGIGWLCALRALSLTAAPVDSRSAAVTVH
ncbi:DUF1772 domain-containing protein [Nocardia lijiangensis]|uniref:DUF1772 domain-containing protein n=1 Tax=Nocardia lijiangensis TaxID=299618 RepID=UPI00082C8714|nr:DUF1772 domain-containing protein [Nocardia lijiangensis]